MKKLRHKSRRLSKGANIAIWQLVLTVLVFPYQNCSNYKPSLEAGPQGSFSSSATAEACTETLPERRVWTLSRSEYDRSVKAVLGNSSNQAQTTFPGEN